MIANCHFTALPAGNNAIVLSRYFRRLLLRNLLEYFNSIQASQQEIEISFLIKRYKELDFRRNFSPVIYALFSNLLKALSNSQVTPIIDALHQLSILPKKDIYNSKFQISTILTENWESDFIKKIRTDVIPRENKEATVILPIVRPDLSEFIEGYKDAILMIRKIDPEFYQEITNYVTRLKLFNGKGLTATTSSSVFGAIYLNIPREQENRVSYFFEHIVHETSHLQLEILFAFDKIILNKETERFKSPLRRDPRPMQGIFHATFVLSRMVRLFKRINTKSKNIIYRNKLDLFIQQFNQGLETIKNGAVLTKRGKLVLDSFIHTAEI